MSICAYLKDIGRGAAGARALGVESARTLMRKVLGGRTSPAQIGALVMALRMKGETPDELVGFLDAVHERRVAVPCTQPVVLIPSCNGSGEVAAANTTGCMPEVLGGMRPVPPPPAHHAAQIVAAVRSLRQGEAAGKSA